DPFWIPLCGNSLIPTLRTHSSGPAALSVRFGSNDSGTPISNPKPLAPCRCLYLSQKGRPFIGGAARCGARKVRYVALHPPQNGGVGPHNAPFGHHLDQVARAHSV